MTSVILFYGSGLRLRKAMQLRIKDLDFPQSQIVVRDAKGQESRVTMLPSLVQMPLKEHLRAMLICGVWREIRKGRILLN